MTALSELNLPHENPSPVFRSPQEARNAYLVIETIEQAYFDQLTSNVRYDGYREDESLENWVNLLGPDVLFLTHPQESARVAHDFVATHDAHSMPLGNALRNKLYVAPWIHDFGELIVEGQGIGDVQYDKKTEADEREEVKIFNKVIDSFSNPEEAEVLKGIYRDIVMDPNSPLGRQFKIIERIGYLETAIRAYLGVRGERITNWQGLSGNVLVHQIEPLVVQRNNFPLVDIFLSENSRILNEMFSDIESRPVPFSRKGEPFYAPNKFENAQEAWEHASHGLNT